ncbi:hypothetical protein LshimejAT787_0901000 [Lyophyllum shimeji]|uniref:Uncharacterized protein n=1 Tax=Lyophyllum shimeji TaxID=47721 RepID=A0A9P3UR38_LYOSH|nr:hypothetical protein LshimejAT787_0901000 [Lyophyllum shimeji]
MLSPRSYDGLIRSTPCPAPIRLRSVLGGLPIVSFKAIDVNNCPFTVKIGPVKALIHETERFLSAMGKDASDFAKQPQRHNPILSDGTGRRSACRRKNCCKIDTSDSYKQTFC